jgi:SPP1 gp7 family putative phage head morphogenesis protein
MITLLNRIDDRLVAEVARRGIGDASFTKRRLDLLLVSIRSIMADAYKLANGSLATDIRELAVLEASFQNTMLTRLIPIDFDVVTPAASQLHAAVNARPFQGRILKDWFKDLEASAFKRARDEITMGFVEGRTSDQIIRSIRGTKAQRFKNGILEISRRAAAKMVNTALNHTANVARSEIYRANESVVGGVQWISTLDNRTSAVCRGRDGKVYDIGRGPRPPAHTDCRSTTIPITRSWKEMGINLKEAPEGTRASMNGQVPAKTTYNDWLKKQPVGFQDDVLGKAKGQLFRKGGLPLDRFTDRAGREYTLPELKAREASAFAKAKL